MVSTVREAHTAAFFLGGRFGICLKIASHLHPFMCRQMDKNSDVREIRNADLQR